MSEELQARRPRQSYQWIYITITIILLAVGIFFLASFVTNKSLPEQFISSYEEMDFLAKEIIQKSVFDYQALGTNFQAKNFEEAGKLLTAGIAQNEINKAKMPTLIKKTGEVKQESVVVSDSLARQNILKLLTLIEERNTKLTTLLSGQHELLSKLKLMIDSGGKEGQLANPDALVAMQQKILFEIIQLQEKIDAAYQELANKKGDKQGGFVDVSNSLLTPQPTMPPTLTPLPTVTPTASPSATPIPTVDTVSPSASDSAPPPLPPH